MRMSAMFFKGPEINPELLFSGPFEIEHKIEPGIGTVIGALLANKILKRQ